jgi:hypothetical protein
MTDPKDNWPLSKYNPGLHYHLHALGVIAVTYAGFQRSIDNLYLFHPRQQKLPDEELIKQKYLKLSDDKRICAVRAIFGKYEKDDAVKAAVKNVLDYFQWCKRSRDQILHAEQYPASFGGAPDTLYLIKQLNRQSPESGQMAFKLDDLRSIADTIRAGIVQSAGIDIYLRVSDVPENRLERSLRVYKHEPLPKPLHVPPPLVLSTNAATGINRQ